METLKLFNAVIANDSDEALPYISKDGYIIMPNAMWAKDKIAKYWEQQKLDGVDLNKTFHKSWEKILTSSRWELFIEQVTHYMSTYGSNFTDEAYIPNEVVSIPGVKVIFKVFRGYSKEELIEKCLTLLKSGIALTEETITSVLSILTDKLEYQFTGDEGIKNREAIVKIADMYGVLPKDTMEFFRYIIYRLTDKSLIIKNKGSIRLIKDSSFNPVPLFNKFGLEKLAEIFNRFKPLFLALKPKYSKTINKISKLSKTYHKPLVSNPLNFVTSIELTKKDMHWLNNATAFALFKAISACNTRVNGQTKFVYRIRNGKSWTTREDKPLNLYIPEKNLKFILDYCKKRFEQLKGKKFYFQENVDIALPTSEKMFVGNLPTGTSFVGESLSAGMYWEDAWGARDLDLSGINAGGKVGWNAHYNQDNSLLYSGDTTSAPNGAVEYLHCKNGLNYPTVVFINVYSGSDTAGYKIIVGSGNKDMSKAHMMDPNKVLAEAKCNAVQKQMILGLLIPDEDKQRFVFLNFGAGQANVSNRDSSGPAIEALLSQWKSPITLEDFVTNVGGEVVLEPSEADFDFSLDKLEKDSLIKLFTI